MRAREARWLLLCWIAGCSGVTDTGDVGRHDAAPIGDTDAGDGAPTDSGAAITDAGSTDVAAMDADPIDAGALDTGPVDAGPKPWWRVLFIGNSYSSANGLPVVLSRLSTDPQSPAKFSVDRRTPGGATWYSHEVNADVTQLIAQGWDYVVLQDQSGQPWGSVGTKDELRSLDAKIKAAGGQTVLYMTWARAPRIVPESLLFKMNLAVNNYYERHGAAVDATVAPAGRAWERVLRTSNLTLHAPDGTHPSHLGTYLTACVLYIAITGQSPIGLSAGGLNVDDAQRDLLQRAAWDTHVERQRRTSPEVGHWPMAADAPTNDFIPNGPLTVGDRAGSDGAAGGATQFGYDGADVKAASVPYVGGMNPSEMTLAFEAHRADWNLSGSSVQAMLSKSWGYRLEQRGAELQASLHTVGTDRPTELAYSTANLAPGWHDLALTYDGATYALWVDATQVATATTSGAIRYYQSAGTEDHRFNGIAVGARFTDRFEGIDTSAPDSGFTGAMSNIRLFVRALTAAELGGL